MTFYSIDRFLCVTLSFIFLLFFGGGGVLLLNFLESLAIFHVVLAGFSWKLSLPSLKHCLPHTFFHPLAFSENVLYCHDLVYYRQEEREGDEGPIRCSCGVMLSLR